MAVIWCDPEADPEEIKLFQGPARVEYEGPWDPGEDMCYDNFQLALAAVSAQDLSETPIPPWLSYEEENAFRLNTFDPPGGGSYSPSGPFFLDTFRDALLFLLDNVSGPGVNTSYIFNAVNQELLGEDGDEGILWRDGGGGGGGTARFEIRYLGASEDWSAGFLEETDFTGGAPEDMQAWLLTHQSAIEGGVVFGSGDITATVAFGCAGECSCSGEVAVEPAPITEADFTAEPPAAPDISCLTRWAQCWCIKRRDGQAFHFTSHDQPLEFRGSTYQPCHSLAASAAELGSLMGAPGNAELMGIIADEAISEQDLYAGKFDRACLEVWLVPWGEDSEHCIPLTPLIRGTTGDLSQGQEGFSMEVLTPGALLQQQPLLETYTPGCRYELGDARCGVDLDALAETGSATDVAVADVSTRAQHRVFWDSSRTEDDGYFDMGVLEWTSGNNAGQVSEVKSFADDQFVLWRPMQKPIEVGDEYEVRPGCDKLAGTCKTKFDNFVNYGGFPDVPGRDSIMQTPNSKG